MPFWETGTSLSRPSTTATFQVPLPDALINTPNARSGTQRKLSPFYGIIITLSRKISCYFEKLAIYGLFSRQLRPLLSVVNFDASREKNHSSGSF
jgi:hypothetical protein